MIPEEYKKYEQHLPLACINYNAVWADKDGNIEKMKKYVAQAANLGYKMIVFPELALTGYECDNAGEDCMHQKFAETVPGPTTQTFAELAKEKDVYIIFGLPERDAEKEDVIYISTAVVGPEGIIGSYRKLHLMSPPLTEMDCFTPGNDLPLFETRFGPIGIQICYDFWTFPEMTRLLVLKGARLVINTAASPTGLGKSEFILQQTGARATENTTYIASAILTGKENKLSFQGHSTIAGRDNKLAQILAEGGSQEGIIGTQLNFELMHTQRAGSPMADKFRYDVVMRELKALAG